MIRRSLLVLAAAASLTAIATPASAAVAPPTGSMLCDLTGSTTFKPGVATTPGAKDIAVKSTAPSAACDPYDTVGGKAVINGATVSFTATLPKSTASCSNWAAETIAATKAKVTVKLLHIETLPNGKVKKTTVATVKPVIAHGNSTLINGGAAIEIYGVIPQNKTGNAAFGGNHFAAVFGSTDASSVACVNGTGPMTKVTYDAPNDTSYSGIYLDAA